MEKKILIVSRSFYPANTPRSFRTTELVKEFARQGHDVTLLTIKNETYHKPFEKEHGVKIKDLGRLKLPSISTQHKYKFVSLIKRALNRGLLQLIEYPEIELMWSVRNSLKQEHGYDLMITIAVPHPIHWGAAWAWESTSRIAKTWVADCGDPFMYNKHDTFNKMKYFHYFENQFLKKADYVSVPFEEMKDLFNDKYREKFKVIPQAFKIDKSELPKYEVNEVPTFIYSGTIMPSYRDPFSLIDFLNNEGYDYRFIIFTKQNHLFKKYGAILEKKIFIKDYIPRDLLLKELAGADFLVNVNTDSVNGKINAIPSKLIDYSISGRPILSYEQSNLPVKTIKEFMDGNYSRAYEGINLDHYRIERVCIQFLKLIP